MRPETVIFEGLLLHLPAGWRGDPTLLGLRVADRLRVRARTASWSSFAQEGGLTVKIEAVEGETVDQLADRIARSILPSGGER